MNLCPSSDSDEAAKIDSVQYNSKPLSGGTYEYVYEQFRGLRVNN